MTTSTTDAEAIARLVSPDSWRIRDRHVAGANDDPGMTESERANALASAECYVQESLRRANRILSYLASRRDAQEPVAHPKIMYVCESCYEHNSEVCGYDRRDIYVTPDGKWLCENCIDAEDTPSRDCVSPPPLYTAPPAPAGEVERCCVRLGDIVRVNDQSPYYADWRDARLKVVGLHLAPDEALWADVIEGDQRHRGNGRYDGETTDFDVAHLTRINAALNGGRE